MSFDIASFQDYAVEFQFGFLTDFMYGSIDDTLAEITVSGYFDTVPGLQIGNRIGVKGSDTAAALCVSGLTPTTTILDTTGQLIKPIYGTQLSFGIGITNIIEAVDWLTTNDLLTAEVVVPDVAGVVVESRVALAGQASITLNTAPTIAVVLVNVIGYRIF